MTHPNDAMPLDALVQVCGHFSTEQGRQGYGCTHPDQEEKDEDGKGSCFGRSCPVASGMAENEPLDRIELISRDYDLDRIDWSDTWMLVHEENLLKRVRSI